ncbi:hypothetical protein MLD38_020599 [Melastoma candidum]|uniref:Uncharacterized protein n=1 Tax=Melastoma candidum TaxID=119954 RepID=A0ACB9QGJ4_9MYRT|nr:hypothetical protein MLD38_020599 [Melastoma candidum]
MLCTLLPLSVFEHARALLSSLKVTESTDFAELVNKETWLSSTKLVVKPDMLFGKRGKSDLVALNLDMAQVAQFVKTCLGVEVEMDLEAPSAFQNGIEIEDNWDKVYGPEATMTGICKQAMDCIVSK